MHIQSGKVREIYECGKDALLIVTRDSWSAFDVKMPQGIPLKGRILNTMSKLTFDLTSDIIPNHVITTDMSSEAVSKQFKEGSGPFLNRLNGRSVLVKKAKQLPFELIVRGYLYGTALEDYNANGGKVCGIQLPPGLVKASKLDAPIFTPSTKSATGHDENISFETMEKELGNSLANKIRDASLAIYEKIAKYSLARGLILADTKFEFGHVNGELTLTDEAVTPDTSRLWKVSDYKEGQDQGSSSDKQYLRDYLLKEAGWTKDAQKQGVTPPLLPQEILSEAGQRYVDAYTIMVGQAPAVVSIIVGSKSDLQTAYQTAAALEQYGVWYGIHILSAHRDSTKLAAYIKETNDDPTVKLHITGAGLAAALPGDSAARTIKPVIGIPLKGELSMMDGLDSVMSMVQMPPGVPVMVVGPVNNGKNAGIAAAQILAIDNKQLAFKLGARLG